MAEGTLILNKLDVAERQLGEAILLFFAQRDPVAIHTLTLAANEIFHDLLSHRGTPETRLGPHAEVIKQEWKRKYRKTIYKAKNFFKHANTDPEDILEFSVKLNHFFIFESIFIRNQLRDFAIREFQIYLLWYGIKYPEHLTEEGKSMVPYSKASSLNLQSIDIEAWNLYLNTNDLPAWSEQGSLIKSVIFGS